MKTSQHHKIEARRRATNDPRIIMSQKGAVVLERNIAVKSSEL